MTLAVARTRALKTHPAKLSGFTRLLLRDLFFSQDVNGQGIRILGRTARVAFHALLADEEALSAMRHAKGSAGITPCAICCTVTDKPKAADIAAGLRSLPQRSPLACSSCLTTRRTEPVWCRAGTHHARHKNRVREVVPFVCRGLTLSRGCTLMFAEKVAIRYIGGHDLDMT